MADTGRSTVRLEAEIGRRHTPGFAWPTLALEAGLFAMAGLATWAAVTGRISMWAGAAVNTVFIYALYTVVHETIHANISSRTKTARWIDLIAGVIACAPLWLFFHHHRRQHMVHHTHTNMDDDPDIYARGSFAGWLFVRLPKTLLAYFNPLSLYRECGRFGCTRRETALTLGAFALSAAVLIGLIAAGYGTEVLVMWFIPWWIGQTVMLTLFTWTPHHDHHETGRYRNTRVSIVPGGNVLLLGQGYHLIHHMIPSIPWYAYEASFEDMRPLLEKHNVRIEGLLPNPTNEIARTAA